MALVSSFMSLWGSGPDFNLTPPPPIVPAAIIGTHRRVKANIPMNYNNYEAKIVEKYRVALTGWPSGAVRNPSDVGNRREVAKLLEALTSGTCEWVALTDDELDERKKENREREARGEVVYKKRKTAARKATKGKGKLADVVDSSDDSDHEDADADAEV